MNKHLLHTDVQLFLRQQENSNAGKIGLAKSPFIHVSSAELATQLTARKKAEKKLPTWYHTEQIYYPGALSIEQTSSEHTAAYKAGLVAGNTCLDITAGFGVDAFYFARSFDAVIACEQQKPLAAIHAHNAAVLGIKNTKVLGIDGIEFLKQTNLTFDLIYADPARRSAGGKVFKLSDCTPDVTTILELLLAKGRKVMIKTAPLLDISLTMNTLPAVTAIHIVSVGNECKEILWLLDSVQTQTSPNIVCATLNARIKIFAYNYGEEKTTPVMVSDLPGNYLYEPDAALLKSGAFNLIGNRFGLEKLHQHTHLYSSNHFETEFPGRIFKIDAVFTIGAFKKLKKPEGNVIARNYPDKPEALVRSYKIIPSKEKFLLFTTVEGHGKQVFQCTIQQYY